MTAQEQQMLQGLTDRINKSPLSEKDPEAEQYLQQTLGRNPDALYMLSQTVLVQQYALEQAQKQLADVKAQLADANEQLEAARQAPPPAPKHSGSFLGNLLGMNDEPKAPPPPTPQYAPVPNAGSYYAPQSGAPQYGQPQYGQAPYAQPQYSQPQYAQPPYAQPGYAPPQSGGFLRSAMTTAAGVAAGAVAFEGIESLMHGFGGGHSGGGYGFESGGGGQGRPEEIVNNYYGDSSPHEHSNNLGSDIEDRRNDTRGFADTGNDVSASQDDNTSDDTQNDFADTSDSGDTYDSSSDNTSSSDSDSDSDDSN